MVISQYSRLRHVCAGGTKRLVIPEGVETIGGGCISGASWLEEVRIPSTVKEVDARAFSGCKGLIRHYDPDGKGYMVIDGWLIPIADVRGRKLTIPVGVRHIARVDSFISVWPDVYEVELPEGLETIGEDVFSGANIETVEFPRSMRRCDGFGKKRDFGVRRPFVRRPSLRNVIFNSGDVAFSLPDSVRRVTFAAGVTDIGADCEGLRRPGLSSGLSGGKGVTTVVLPAGLRSIHALPDFPELTEITIPSSVTNIGKTVFQGCKKLKSVGVEKNGSIECVPIEDFRRQWDLAELKNPAVSPGKGNLRQGGLLRASRLQRQQQEAAAKVQADAEKAQREAELAEQRAQLLALQEALRRVREAKAAAEEKQKDK